MEKRILVFGASIVWGAWDIAGGWVQRLRQHIDKKNLADDDYFCLVYNLGVSGDGVKDMLARFKNEALARHPHNPNTIILSTGNNDSVVNNETGQNNLAFDEFQKMTKELILLAQKHAADVVVMGGLPIDKRKADPISWQQSHSYKNDLVKQYNKAVAQICQELEVPFLEMFERLSGPEFISTLDDGVHPNDQGHEMIAEIVIEELEKRDLI